MKKRITLEHADILEAIGDYAIKHKLISKECLIYFEYEVQKSIYSKTKVDLKRAILEEN